MFSRCNQLAVRRRGQNHQNPPATQQPQVISLRAGALLGVRPGPRPTRARALEQVQAAAAAAAAVSRQDRTIATS
eukprot:2542389-Prymnesium_polylepis.1